MLQINVLGKKPARGFRGPGKREILCLTRVLVVLGLGLAVTLLTPRPPEPAPVSQATAGQAAPEEEEAADETPAIVVALRPVYRFSVVPGGVESREELREAMRRDSVVAQHYERVRLANIEQTVVQRPRLAYVSYRIRERVYWTRRPVLLHAGEKLLTDGHTVIRERCGNQVAFEPRLPVAKADPTDMEIVGELIPPPERKIPPVLVIPPPEHKRFVPIPPVFPPPRKHRPPRPRIGAGDFGWGVPWPAIAVGIAGIFLMRSGLRKRSAR